MARTVQYGVQLVGCGIEGKVLLKESDERQEREKCVESGSVGVAAGIFKLHSVSINFLSGGGLADAAPPIAAADAGLSANGRRDQIPLRSICRQND